MSPIACGDWGSSRGIEATSLAPTHDPTARLEDLAEAEGAGTYVEVLSVLVTPEVSDVGRFLRSVAAVLGDDGRFLFVEPDAVARSWAAVAAPVIKSVSGLDLGRDFTGAMWDSGLSVASIDRRPVARTAWPLTKLVSGVARLAPRDDTRSRRSS